MTNLIFSKRFLKTKLALITIFLTIGYHYVKRESKTLNTQKTSSPSSINFESHSPAINDSHLAYDDTHKLDEEEKIHETPFKKDACIIPSKWVVEYLREVRGRAPSVHLPEAPMALVIEYSTKSINLNEIVESEIYKKLETWINRKELWESTFSTLFWDLLDYFGISFNPLVWTAKIFRPIWGFVSNKATGGYNLLSSGASKSWGFTKSLFLGTPGASNIDGTPSPNQGGFIPRLCNFVGSVKNLLVGQSKTSNVSDNLNNQTPTPSGSVESPPSYYSRFIQYLSNFFSRNNDLNNNETPNGNPNIPVEEVPENSEDSFYLAISHTSSEDLFEDAQCNLDG